MIMDPLDLRADESALRGVDPLTRARQQMESGERAEAAAAAERQVAARERFAERMQAEDMTDRIQLYRQGFLDRELQVYRARVESERRGPGGRAARRAGPTGGPQWAAADAAGVRYRPASGG